MPRHTITINGRRHSVEADNAMPLLWVLRDRLALFGTKYGCGIGVCGACTVHENGLPVRSCLIPVAATRGKQYTTIEGLSADASHPCQRAWMDEDVAQCGFCQPGFIMEAAGLLARHPAPTDDEITLALSTHVCRCGTYTRMRRAVHTAARLAREPR